jgi:peptide/nickel transport system substrate-binding protein
MTTDDNDEIDEGERASPSRRNLILGAAGAGVGALALWAFLRNSLGGGRVRSGASSAGDELVVAFDGAAISKFVLDPHNSTFAPHSRVIRSIFDNLTVLLPDQSVGPWLAESWELSPDRTTYDFKLRQGVTFHDGAVFDAAALKANFDRLADPNNTLAARSSLGPYAGSEVVESHRLRLRLSQPFTPLLRNLSMTKLAIVSPSAAAKYHKLLGQHPVGTGPFRFVGLTQGTEVRLERNPDYAWAPSTAAHPGPPYLARLTFKNVPEESTRVAVLQNGQAQVADLIPPQNLLALKADPDFKVLEKELLNTNYALFLNVGKAPWDDEEIRLAVRLALDIDEIVRVIYLGTLPRAWSVLSPSMFGSAEKELTGSWKPDRARAVEILNRRGWATGQDGVRVKDGKRLTISFIDTQGNREKRLDVVQLVRRQLAPVGIDLTIDSEPSGAIAAKVASNDYDLTGGASYHADPDILRSYFSPSSRAVLSGNRVNDPELTAWLEAGAAAPDGPGRADLYQRAERKISDKTYAIPIYVLLYNLGVAKTVSGVAIDAHGFPQFHDARLNG